MGVGVNTGVAVGVGIGVLVLQPAGPALLGGDHVFCTRSDGGPGCRPDLGGGGFASSGPVADLAVEVGAPGPKGARPGCGCSCGRWSRARCSRWWHPSRCWSRRCCGCGRRRRCVSWDRRGWYWRGRRHCLSSSFYHSLCHGLCLGLNSRLYGTFFCKPSLNSGLNIR